MQTTTSQLVDLIAVYLANGTSLKAITEITSKNEAEVKDSIAYLMRGWEEKDEADFEMMLESAADELLNSF